MMLKMFVLTTLISLQSMTGLFGVDFDLKPSSTRPVRAHKMNTQEALKLLVEGNKRFAEDKITCEDRNNERRAALLATQNPFAIVLGCADSRIPVELVFDQGVGDLFVVRVAGNVAGSSEIESIEYAIKHLDSILVVVLGHENCAAVSSVLYHDAADIPEISSLIEPALRPLHSKTDKLTVEEAVKGNIRLVVDTLKQSRVLKPLLDQKKIMVIGGYYRLSTGLVEFL